ncbi:hypothetical protein VOLCADRAFT_85787 [Volvox carteri f. nagariensis]|uniref:Pherophorin domain-containing protein n=1 Tax=Volvox carteri f. nagariensis TaxID=3068 RepID=D8TGZ5_VOLCA|nr:uncharacterized protein VOLCADRAFT_85787 [Volvox carteri f. nagariensis]EFJ52622.1 hypothetical protein VOLCADRAFT_85787 [Volvox carteri f. nagariensis]|eukprot:XP_002945627.1 hypothetical protein VOLCADRAFT_85787 [Volvox carteri f. nagariensis]
MKLTILIHPGFAFLLTQSFIVGSNKQKPQHPKHIIGLFVGLGKPKFVPARLAILLTEFSFSPPASGAQVTYAGKCALRNVAGPDRVGRTKSLANSERQSGPQYPVRQIGCSAVCEQHTVVLFGTKEIPTGCVMGKEALRSSPAMVFHASGCLTHPRWNSNPRASTETSKSASTFTTAKPTAQAAPASSLSQPASAAEATAVPAQPEAGSKWFQSSKSPAGSTQAQTS